MSPWTKETLDGVFRVFLGCFVGSCLVYDVIEKAHCIPETLAFHLSIMVACYVVLACVGWVQSLRQRSAPVPESDIKREFRYVTLSLLHLVLRSSAQIFLDTPHAILFVTNEAFPLISPHDLASNIGARAKHYNPEFLEWNISLFPVLDEGLRNIG